MAHAHQPFITDGERVRSATDKAVELWTAAKERSKEHPAWLGPQVIMNSCEELLMILMAPIDREVLRGSLAEGLL